MPKKQLLFLEDEGYVVLRVEELLRAFPQFEVTRCDDAEKARALLEEKPYDVLITDIYLRGASGLEFSHLARAKNKDACVIVITSLHNSDLAAKAVKEGAMDFVVKPPGLERLSSVLKLASLVKGLTPEEQPEGQP